MTFDSSITGNYQSGSMVLQKADSIYDDADKEDIDDIRNLPKGQGLAGAVFEVYCDPDEEGPEAAIKPENLAHFLTRDASENRDTYQYLHSGKLQNKPVPGEDERLQLPVNDDGKLILGHMNLNHPHWLVEKAAPKGYYLDDTPIELNRDADQIVYKMLPNIARAVMLKKEDSRTNHPVPDAVFKLTTAEGTEIQFTTKVVGGITVYWPTDSASGVPLKTNDKGELRIHGLDAGDYTLTEIGAPGYKLSDSAPSFTFTLKEKQPDRDTLIKDNGFYYTPLEENKKTVTIVSNTPRTTAVTLSKENGQHDKLSGAFFALLEWKGTEAEWKTNSGDMSKWELVPLNTNNSNSYFTTTAEINPNVEVPVELQPLLGKKIPGAATDTNGTLTIHNVPVGHFMLVEVQAPTFYKPNDQLFYFDVNAETLGAETLGKKIRLYRSANGSSPVDNNIIHNYERPAQFALVKYAEGETAPEITGGEQMPAAGESWDETIDGWKYQGNTIERGKGLPGVKYKLFAQLGVSQDPEPEELEAKNWSSFVDYNGASSTHDPCVAYGSTNKDGILSWDQMTYRPDLSAWNTNGIPLGKYYLVEIQAAEGFVTYQTPILLPLDARCILVNAKNPVRGL